MKYLRTPDKPVELVVVNCDSASGRSMKHVASVLKRSAKGADVVLACECFSIHAKDVLTNFHVVQFGEINSALAGSIVAIRKTRGSVAKSKLVFGAVALMHVGVRSRYWVKTRLQIDRMKPRLFSAGHAQPKRAWELWSAYMLRAPRGVLGLDVNKHRRATKARFPMRKVRQSELMAAVIPANIPCGPGRVTDEGGDHKTLRVTLWPDA